MPDTSAIGKLDMRATTAGVSARSRSTGPSVSAVMKPRVGINKTVVMAASAPLIPQARVDMEAADTPAMRARSGFAADARMARPKRLRRRKTASATTRIGLTMSIPLYEGVTSSTPTWNLGMKDGWGKVLADRAWLLSVADSARRSWAIPSVATKLMIRGALRNRRMTTTQAPH